MMHTERDATVFMSELVLIAGALFTAAYAVAVLIALVLMAFRSRRLLYTSFVLSSIASIPLLSSLLLLWPYLPQEFDINSTIGVLLAVYAAVLSFVWAAPSMQYWKVQGSNGPGSAM